MAYFYVKNSLGTRTSGGGLTKQTGSFTALGAANVYAKITDAITDGATSGDYICVSDAHSVSNATGYIYLGPTSGDLLYYVSVADANCDTFAKASAVQEEATSSGSLAFRGRINCSGMYFKSSSQINMAINNTMLVFDRCDIELAGAGDYIFFYGDGCACYSYDSTWIGAAGSNFGISGGSVFEMIGGSFTGWTDLFNYTTGGNGGATGRFYGVDLSSITGYLVEDGGSNPLLTDTTNITFSGCKLNASLTGFWNETKANLNQRITVANCSSSSSAAEYQYHQGGYGGAVDDETSIYRDASTAFPGTQKISLKCVTNTNATKAAPFWFDCPTRYAELSSTSTDLLSIYILSSATLYDSDVWAEVIYPDGTNKQTPNFISTRHADVMDTNGTELGTNTEAWTGRTAENRYQIDIDTSADAGADSVPIIRLYVAKASATIYFCPTVGLS